MKSKFFVLAAIILLSVPAFADYSFKVTNNTNTKIAKILVSQDGEEFGQFNIGAGIPAGKTVTLVWDESTNGEDCEQYFKAVFANGEESEAQQFDFCEEGVELEFE
jgi:myo-inositol-hexaphosphate 3-phosphohydrolase